MKSPASPTTKAAKGGKVLVKFRGSTVYFYRRRAILFSRVTYLTEEQWATKFANEQAARNRAALCGLATEHLTIHPITPRKSHAHHD